MAVCVYVCECVVVKEEALEERVLCQLHVCLCVCGCDCSFMYLILHLFLESSYPSLSPVTYFSSS